MLKEIIDVSLAEFWFEWGNEPNGCVSYGRYNYNGVYKFIGFGPKEWVTSLRLSFNNPHS